MLEEIERDGFFLFAARREPIPLNIDYSNMQVLTALPDTSSKTSSETSLAKTSPLEKAVGKFSSLYNDQKPDPSNNSAHRSRQLLFSSHHPSFLDREPNMVEAVHLEHYAEYYKIPDQVKLMLPGGKTAWNPPKGSMAIYYYMLNCGVTQPLQPFIVHFFSDVNLAPIVMSILLLHSWLLMGIDI
ncbi:hypothetical protein ACOSQ3_019028 [Xanthoceras sorbifolium]